MYAKVLRGTARPIDGQPFQLLTRLARELDCVIGGGFVAVRGKHTYGTYVLAEPNGAVHLHDKDIPTAWEQNYYKGGDDDGVVRCETLGATVGLMSGWEWARNRTSGRVRAGGAQLVLGGMCWPSLPTNWPGPLRRLAEREHGIWREQARALPGQVARLTGVPVAHASHVGPITGETPMGPGIPWPTVMIGESQICDRDGTILARLTLEDGEGHVSADVEIREPAPLEPIGERFWIPTVHDGHARRMARDERARCAQVQAAPCPQGLRVAALAGRRPTGRDRGRDARRGPARHHGLAQIQPSRPVISARAPAVPASLATNAKRARSVGRSCACAATRKNHR